MQDPSSERQLKIKTVQLDAIQRDTKVCGGEVGDGGAKIGHEYVGIGQGLMIGGISTRSARSAIACPATPPRIAINPSCHRLLHDMADPLIGFRKRNEL